MWDSSSATEEAANCYRIIRGVALRFPDNIALTDDDLTMSYSELVNITDERSRTLQRAGIVAGDRVAMIAESSALYIATVLAIWKLEAVLVTIYPSSSQDDIVRALEISEPGLIIVSDQALTETIEARLPGFPVTTIEQFSPQRVNREVCANPDNLREPLSMICFSSGTTSDPKAIMLSATTVCNTAETYAEVWRLTETERALISLPMAWLYGLASTTLAVLFRGGTVVVARRSRPETLIALAAEHQVTFIAGVTVLFAKLTRHVPAEQTREAFAHLRLSISGGEPRNEAVFAAWRDLTGSAVLDAYCASECLPLVTYDPLRDAEPVIGSAGRLVPRQLLRVVDPQGNDVSPGEIGEALASGPGLMLGYWKKPELTAEVITEDGWYRMKDLVRVDEDGYVFVTGRLSEVIIRGGTNISPTEIEAVINAHPLVSQSAVLGLPDDIYGQKVVAAVTVNDESVTSDDIGVFVRERLSSYKVPSEIWILNDLPLNTTTAKINKKVLAEQLANN